MADSEKNGIAYRVTVGKQKIHNNDVSGLFLPWSEQKYLASLLLTGAGNSVRIIAGVALIAAAVVLCQLLLLAADF